MNGKELTKSQAGRRTVREGDTVRLFVVEDDLTISEPLVSGLTREGYEFALAVTDEASNGAPGAKSRRVRV